MGGLTLFAAQGCKAPKQVAEQAKHPNIIYVFPDQYRNQAMGFWNQEGFRDKVNFRGDPVHTPNIDTFARESGADFRSKQLSAEQPPSWNVADRYVSESQWCTFEL